MCSTQEANLIYIPGCVCTGELELLASLFHLGREHPHRYQSANRQLAHDPEARTMLSAIAASGSQKEGRR